MAHIGTHSPQPISRPSGRTDRLSVDPEALFVYGSLLLPEVCGHSWGRVPDRRSRQRRPAGASRPSRGAGTRASYLVTREASGMLITGLTPDEWCVHQAHQPV